LRTLANRLSDHVKQGPQLPESPFQSATGAGWATAARAQIGQEQRAITVAAALDILARFPQAQQAQHLLDLGGGPGWVAIELARRFPNLTGVVFDWPETAAVAHENIISAGLAERLCSRGGDLVKDPLGQDFDLVWCSSVLHFVPDIDAVLTKVFAAMAPGGRFVCVHAELPTDASEAAQVMPYYLPMRMLGRHVLCEGGTASALKAAGFVVEDCFLSHQFPMAPVQVVMARKPMSPAPLTVHHE
jgi:SAM-dependent methyltransferase